MSVENGPIGIRELADGTSKIIAALPVTGPRLITKHGEPVALLVPLTPEDVQAGSVVMAEHALRGFGLELPNGGDKAVGAVNEP